jgi:molybdopterin synthase sulfur carrier subunit
MATVFIPALLRKLTAGRDSMIASGGSVAQIIDDIERQFPGFRVQLVENGELKPGIAVSVDGEIAVGGLLEPVAESSKIHFLPALGGG